VAIEAAIKGLCIGAFTAHLAQEKQSTIQRIVYRVCEELQIRQQPPKKAGRAKSEQAIPNK
jgi:hypothetical protein